MKNYCSTNHDFTAFVVVFFVGSLMMISSIVSAQGIVRAIKSFEEAKDTWEGGKVLSKETFKGVNDVHVSNWYDSPKGQLENEGPPPEKVGQTNMCKGVSKGISVYNTLSENDSTTPDMQQWYKMALRIGNYCKEAADQTIETSIEKTNNDNDSEYGSNPTSFGASHNARLFMALGMALLVCVVVLRY